MDVEAQISGYFDDALTREQVEELFARLKGHPEELQRFVRAAYLHRMMVDHFRAKSQVEHFAEEDGETAESDPVDPRIYRLAAVREAEGEGTGRRLPEGRAAPSAGPSKRRWWGYAAAALVLVGAGVAYLTLPGRTRARLLGAEEARWAPGSPAVKVGEYVQRGEMTLTGGLVKLGFDNGNEVVVEGPARFAIRGDLEVALQEGRVSAVVSKAGRGLRVHTPDASIVDLGTEFSVGAGRKETEVLVYLGKVVAAGGGGSGNGGAQTIAAGSGAVVSNNAVMPVPFEKIQTSFKRALTAETRNLGLVDLLAGGDGTGDAQGYGIDAATGATGSLPAAGLREGQHKYVPLKDHPLLDGCFIPGDELVVDSAGDRFAFPPTAKPTSFGLIWAGSNVPWAEKLPISTRLPGEAPGEAEAQVLVLHSNNGMTLDLEKVRARCGGAKLLTFRARVGMSTPPAETAKASVHVLVDGVSRFQRLGFTNHEEAFEVVCPLAGNDRFLTLATTDGGDTLLWDWVLWTDPHFEAEGR